MNTKTRAQRKRDGESGFTLIEVMVVVLIIGILLAIGVPTFLGARTRAQDRAAQTSLRIAQSSAMVIYTDNAKLSEASTATLTATEPSVTWIASSASSTGPMAVSVNASDAAWIGAAKSDSGSCFYINISGSGATSGTVTKKNSSTSTCTAAGFASAPTNGW